MTKQDVIELLRMHAAVNPDEKEVIDGIIEFLLLKFRQDTYDWKFEKNHGYSGGLQQGASDSIQDGVPGRGN